jgi:hypothetical protein
MTTYRQRVLELWPQATLGADFCNGRMLFEVKITDGRWAHGQTREEAWEHAWESIIQDEELAGGQAGNQGGAT